MKHNLYFSPVPPIIYGWYFSINLLSLVYSHPHAMLHLHHMLIHSGCIKEKWKNEHIMSMKGCTPGTQHGRRPDLILQLKSPPVLWRQARMAAGACKFGTWTLARKPTAGVGPGQACIQASTSHSTDVSSSEITEVKEASLREEGLVWGLRGLKVGRKGRVCVCVCFFIVTARTVERMGSIFISRTQEGGK